MASSVSPWPAPGDAPAIDDLTKCVHCGLCLNACPTYVVTGLEVESPRGRIYLARSVDEERIPLTEAVQDHWELCLQCRACEAVCPSGVPYGRIMEHARAQLDAAAPKDRGSRRVRKFLLRNIIARPRVLAAAMWPARFLAASKARRLARRLGLLGLIPPLARMEAQLPPSVGAPVRAGDPVATDEAGPAGKALLFTGCVMGELFGDVHRATARVLARQGFAVEAPRGQRCCGALHAHDGDLEFARTLARKNIDTFEEVGGTIVVNSAGCGAAMKEYGDLLADDPEYAGRAKAFSARVRDFSEVATPESGGAALRMDARVAYQDACHLAHAQRITEQPRALLEGIEGCEMVRTEGADMCCGAAGLYSLVQPAMSGELRARKAEQFRQHKPDVVVTANPGCQMQYNAAVREAGITARVMHLAEVLDEAYGDRTPPIAGR